jgi:hypothetical protein
MSDQQPGILADVPAESRYLFFRPRPDAELRASLRSLARLDLDDSLVVGVGSPTAAWTCLRREHRSLPGGPACGVAADSEGLSAP